MLKVKLLVYPLLVIGLVVGETGNLPVVVAEENSNYLEIPETDPLLPPGNLNRQLTPLEQRRVKEEIATLEAEAITQLQQGNSSQAWELWFRQLRLYRALGKEPEIIALGTLGERAWQDNRRAELKVISDRLEAIYQLQDRDPLLPLMGTSARQIRNLDTAVAIYSDLYRLAKDDNAKVKAYGEILGELHLAKFNYQDAATVYQSLFDQTDSTPEKEQYALKLVKIYGYLQQPAKAVALQQELKDYYLDRNQTNKLAALDIALGDNYQAIEETELAIQAYQEAIAVSESIQQIALLNEAWEKLGILYQSQQQYDLAIEANQKSIESNQAIGNLYGVVNNYERLGKIYLELQDKEQAVKSFSEALRIAQNLDYKVSYFANLLETIKTTSQ